MTPATRVAAAVARDLDLTASALAGWVKQMRADRARAPAVGGALRV